MINLCSPCTQGCRKTCFPPLPQLSNLHIWNIHFRTHDACYLFLPCMELRNNLNLLRQLYKNTSTYSTTTHLFQIQGVPRNMTIGRRLEMSSGNFEFICDKITQFWLNDSILIFVKNLISIYRKYSANMIALIQRLQKIFIVVVFMDLVFVT